MFMSVKVSRCFVWGSRGSGEEVCSKLTFTGTVFWSLPRFWAAAGRVNCFVFVGRGCRVRRCLQEWHIYGNRFLVTSLFVLRGG